MDLDDFSIDPDLFEGGKRIDLDEGVYFTVRSSNSTKARKAIERLRKPYSHWNKDLPDHIAARLEVDYVVQGLLVDFCMPVGGTPCNLDMSKPEDQKALTRILADPKRRWFVDKVKIVAVDIANFQAQADEVLEKNSDVTPAGGSGGGGKQKS